MVSFQVRRPRGITGYFRVYSSALFLSAEEYILRQSDVLRTLTFPCSKIMSEFQ